MFEIIGLVTTLVLVVVIGKTIYRFLIKRNLRKAAMVARKLGVPEAFILESFKYLDDIKDAMVQLGQLDDRFDEKPVFIQFGESIALNYEGQLKGYVPRYPGYFEDGAEDFDEVINISVSLGVPRHLVGDLYVENHSGLNEFAAQIDSPGSIHHNASFEERLAVSISTLYRSQNRV